MSNKGFKGVSRRGFLIAITGSALAAAAGCRPAGIEAPTPYVPGSGKRSTDILQSTPTSAGTTVATSVDPQYGKVTYDKMIITTPDDLYITQYDYSKTPNIDPAQWSLKVDGLVDNPITLDYAAVKALPAFEDMRTLECIGNPLGGNLIGNVNWKGFAFEEILKQVKLKPTATHARFEAADGYSTSVALEWITQPGVMMAYGMNGGPLTVDHGYPLRILMPGLYGQKMPRWITHIEFIDHYFKGYWESNGWSDVASVQTNSIIMQPQDGYTTKPGASMVIQGVAWAGKRKITSVELQVEGGPWMPAKLAQGPSPLAWTQWYFTWTPPAPGSYRIGVRATDETGFVQNTEGTSLFGGSDLNGVSAIERISLRAS
jgi:DMSO/TMAO reductase YedYZ molybdopterin-dependent catalytic subunit